MVLLVVNEILTGEFLNSLVMNLVSFPIYANCAHFCVSFFPCFSVCLFILLFRIEGSCLLLYMICFMVLYSCSLLDLFNWQLFTLLSIHRIAACLCSGGWHESLGIMISVVVGFRYMLKEKFSVSLCTVISKKLILLSDSFSIENAIVGIALLTLIVLMWRIG